MIPWACHWERPTKLATPLFTAMPWGSLWAQLKPLATLLFIATVLDYHWERRILHNPFPHTRPAMVRRRLQPFLLHHYFQRAQGACKYLSGFPTFTEKYYKVSSGRIFSRLIQKINISNSTSTCLLFFLLLTFSSPPPFSLLPAFSWQKFL